MTLDEFERRLKVCNPRLNLRRRGRSDVVGVFDGNDFLFRLNQGELQLNGYRMKYFTDHLETHYGPIERRGRKTAVRLLEKMGKVTIHDRGYLLWGASRK